MRDDSWVPVALAAAVVWVVVAAVFVGRLLPGSLWR